MRTFTMYREADESGVSGTGKVLEGCEFTDGTVVCRWASEDAENSTVNWENRGTPGAPDYRSGFERFLSIHVLPHPDNRTRIVWEDGTETRY